MNTESMKKLDRLLYILRLFQVPGRRYRVREIADALGINEDTANKYLQELSGSGLLPIFRDKNVWMLPEGASVPQLDLSLSYAEAVSLYLAGGFCHRRRMSKTGM